MPPESIPIESPAPALAVPPVSAKPLRLWPAGVLLSLFWGLHIVIGRLEKPYFVGFMYGMGAAAVLALLYFAWWWTNRRIRLADRLSGFLLLVGGAFLANPLCDKSIGLFGLLTTGLPLVLTTWTLWLLVVQKFAVSWKRLGAVVVVALTWGSFALVRMDGLNASLQADLRWRWAPTAEELFLTEQAHPADSASAPEPSPLAAWTPSVRPSDWTAFRGPDRDGIIRGVTIATDWKTAPPRLRWRQRVGPAWSSVVVLGGRLFTQEQRGEQETVVCYDASTGNELWVHADTARFWEGVSGAGPRATPTFADGRLYTLGGTGILNCLDAAMGKQHWSRTTTADTGAQPPMWGFSGSPLVVDGLVIVFAGGNGDKNLLAYRAETGEPAWTAPAGQNSYSSPELVTLAGKRQCLILSDHGLTAVDPATGAVLWKTGTPWPGAPRTVQPRLVGATQLLVGTLDGAGVSLIDVTPDGDGWTVVSRWESTDLKPEFPDFVVHRGHVYGFDISLFCCLDLATGKRCWKAGRYGRGQVVLLADQGLLLVMTEGGEAVLLSANPQRHEELGRFRALNGKTWNHPVLADGRLYVRNAEEMACYELELSPRSENSAKSP